MGRKQIRCHGDPDRFEVVAAFIHERYGDSIRYIADVAGGQGLLSRILNKKYHYSPTVIDPRGHVLVGVDNRQCEYDASMAGYYDLVVGLHPDEAIRPVILSARHTRVLAVPCCNHWDVERKLGARALVEAICQHLTDERIACETITLPFAGPKNIAIIAG